jgi:hypothetical protein
MLAGTGAVTIDEPLLISFGESTWCFLRRALRIDPGYGLER